MGPLPDPGPETEIVCAIASEASVPTNNSSRCKARTVYQERLRNVQAFWERYIVNDAAWIRSCHLPSGGQVMRRWLLSITAAVSLNVGTGCTALAQNHEIPTLNSCIREFYDPGMYNYLTFKNNCSHSVTLVFVAKDSSGASGTMELRPGAKDSVGRLKGQVPKVGGFQFYVCPSGYLPVDETGKVVTKPGTSFKCKPKPE